MHVRPLALIGTFAACALFSLPSCQSTKAKPSEAGSKSMPAKGAAKGPARGASNQGAAASESLLPVPKVFEHEGRIYVLGSQHAVESFEADKSIPFAKTRVGEGPRGETVVIESSEGSSALADRLWNEWSAVNVVYIERERDGRIYVLGSNESAKSFDKTGHMPYTRTLIGEGPGGETVVLEVDKAHPAYVERLHATFRARHESKDQ